MIPILRRTLVCIRPRRAFLADNRRLGQTGARLEQRRNWAEWKVCAVAEVPLFFLFASVVSRITARKSDREEAHLRVPKVIIKRQL